MTRMSKQARKRAVSPRKPKTPGLKTGPKKDNLESGHKVHVNAIAHNPTNNRFIPKIGNRA